jgi:hypothetical protein
MLLGLVLPHNGGAHPDVRVTTVLCKGDAAHALNTSELL